MVVDVRERGAEPVSAARPVDSFKETGADGAANSDEVEGASPDSSVVLLSPAAASSLFFLASSSC